MENEEMDQVTVGQVAKKYGVILGAASIAFFLILALSGIYTESWAGWLGFIVSITIIVLAHNSFKADGDGYMSFGEGFKIGALMSVISAVISNAFTWVYISFVDNAYLEPIKEKAYNDMVEQGMAEEQIEQAMEFTSFMFDPTMITVFGIILGIVGGIVVSLIVTIFTKNNRPEEI